MSDAQRAAWQQACRQVEAELPDLIDRNRMATAAAAEPTLSGELRRAIHSGPSSLSTIAASIGVTVLELDQVEISGSRSQYEFLQTVIRDYNHLAAEQPNR